MDENGEAWLAFGSFWRGLKMFKLDESLTRMAQPQVWFPISRRPEGTAEDTSKTDTAVTADPRGKDFDAGNGAVEAPFIFKHDGWYYLFVSYDLCCRGEKSTYNVVVGRSKTVTGPYFDKDGVSMMNSGGTTVAKGNEQFAGVGHCSVYTFGDKDYIFMHGYDKDQDYRSKLLVRELKWSDDGWPVVVL
jgi:arabinan endo-1,5-alpha-L-arabinosidase